MIDHGKKSRPLHLVSNADAPTPVVSAWKPPLLEQYGKLSAVDARQRGLSEIAVDLAIMSRRSKKILQTLDQAGSLNGQLLLRLTRRLDIEMAVLLLIIQSLQSK